MTDLPGEPVAGRAGEHDVVAEERLEGDAAVPPSRADDPQLELTLGDALDHRLRVGDRERDRDARVLPLELAEQHRDDRAPRPGGGADLQRAAELTAARRVELVEQLPLEREHPLRPAVEREPCLGRLDAPS